jgi:DNA-binding GntR family transcriptional regulator
MTLASQGPGLAEANLGAGADTPLHEAVYQEIRRNLIAGQFQPGEAVTLRGLAGQLGTSAMPVREALRRLVAERALDLGPNRSARVPIVTSAKYAEICDVRIALEGLAAEKAALLIADSEIDRIERICAEVSAAAENHDAATYFAKNQEMHFSVYRAARSPLLLDMIEGIWLRVGPTLNYLFHDIRFAGRAAATNLPIVDALRSRRGSAAREAVAHDISHAMVGLVQHLPQGDGAREIGLAAGSRT